MLRSRAAAASHGLDAHPCDLFHPVGEFLRPDIVNGPASLCAGKSRIGIYDHRYTADFREPLYDRNHLLRAQSAVYAQGVHAKALQKRHCGVYAAACQHFPLAVKGDGNKDRQVAVFLGCQDRRLRLVAVRHRLDQDKVRACAGAVSDHFSEQFHGLLKGKIPQRFQKFPCGSDIQRHIGVLPPAPALRFLREIHRRGHDLLEIIGKFESICPKRISIENIAARPQIPAVKVYDVLRSSQVPCLGKFASAQSP